MTIWSHIVRFRFPRVSKLVALLLAFSWITPVIIDPPSAHAAATYSTLFTTLNESPINSGYWIVRSNVRYAHQFTAGGPATINQFIVAMGSTQHYESQIKIVFYTNNANTVGTKLGELLFSSSTTSPLYAYYGGTVTLPSAGTYWFELQPTGAIANHYYDGTSSTGATGSAAGWSQYRTSIANGSDSATWGYFSGTPYPYPRIAIQTLVASGPSITSITASSGTTVGGTIETITGSNFTSSTGVTFGGVAGSSFSVVSSTQITVTTPAHAAGAVDVVVQNPNGNATLTSGYTYLTPAGITSASITGTARQGQILTAGTTGIVGSSTTTNYQWKNSSDGITYSNVATGGTASTYTLQASDVGK